MSAPIAADGAEVDVATGEIPTRTEVLMTEDEARTITAEIKAWAGTLWQKLKQAHDGQAWRALGYGSWRDYIDNEFDMGKSQAYRLLTHANAVYELADAAGIPTDEVSPMGDTLNERTTRGLDIDQVCQVVREVVMGLPKEATTATRLGLVEAIVDRLKPQPAKTKRTTQPKPKPGDDLPADDPELAARMDAAIERAKAKLENQSAPDGAPPSPPADTPPAVPSPAGVATGDGSSHPVPGSTSTDAPPAGPPVDGGVEASAPSTPPQLPSDWRDRLANGTYLLSLNPVAVAAVASDDDRADLTELASWLDRFKQATEEQG